MNTIKGTLQVPLGNYKDIQYRTDEEQVSDKCPDNESPGKEYGHEFSDQGTWPVIESRMSSNPGTMQTGFLSYSQTSVDVIVAGNQGCFLFAAVVINYLLGVDQILSGSG